MANFIDFQIFDCILVQIRIMNLSQSIKQFFSFLFTTSKSSKVKGVISFKNIDSNIIEIKLTDLICIKSMGNKSFVYYDDGATVKFEVVRKSLKYFQTEIEYQNPKIIRCHKSFIANLNKVSTVSGTTKGFKLHHKGLDFKIPVSRSLGIDDINQADLFSK